MEDRKYYTYWSILDAPSHTWKANIICLIIAVIGFIIWLLIKKFSKDKGNTSRAIMLWGSAIFSALTIIAALILTFAYPTDANTLKVLNSPATPKIEGVVSNFQRNLQKGETVESFSVDNVSFTYGDALPGKFNSFSETNNTVIFNGQSVRITYFSNSDYGVNKNKILKIEIGE